MVDNPDGLPWGWVEELLARLIEEVSILASDRRRKEPAHVKRPWEKDTTAGLTISSDGSTSARGIDAMLALAGVTDVGVYASNGEPPVEAGDSRV